MRTHKGFTLIELLVVITILGIVSSIVLAGLGGATEKANLAAAKGNLASLRSEMANIAIRGRFPATFCADGTVPILGTDPSKGVVAMSKGVRDSGYVLECGISEPNESGMVNFWSAWFAHTSSGPYFCVDSNGFAGDRTTDPASVSPSYTCPTS